METEKTNNLIVKVENPIDKIPDFINIVFECFNDLKIVDDTHHSHININKLLSNNINFCYISLDDDLRTINGYLIGEKKLLMDGRLVFFITYIYVASVDRNKGIGTTLIEKIILKCRKTYGINYIMLMCRTESKINNFYLKLGFVQDPIIKLKNMNVMIYFL